MYVYEYAFHVGVLFFIVFYFFYYLICLFASRKKEKNKINNNEENSDIKFPKISFIIPVYNENAVIKKKFKNINDLMYPKDKIEILFVDGGSTDGTLQNIKNNMKKYNIDVKIIEQGKRLGFNKAVIDGFTESTGEIIFIPGAETIYSPDVLKLIVPYFSNMNVGAVNGRQIITNLDAGISPKHEYAYRNMQEILRIGENELDTLFDVKGEIVACRRNICEKLVNKPEFTNKGCIDACFFMQSRMDGYLSVYEPNAVYYELAPASFKDSFKQRLRRAATLIQNLLIFKSMLFNKEFGLFGMLIMPAHFLMLVILPYVLLFDIFVFFILNIVRFPNPLLLTVTIIGIVLSASSNTIQSFIKLQIILIIANIKLLRGIETQKFERLASTRIDT